MAQWEYCKFDLGAISLKSTDVEVLSELGKDGWELVNILVNNIAYFKRQFTAPAPPKTVRRTKAVAAEVEEA